VLGILPGVIGCIQATETIKILLGKGTSLSGRLLLYDALKMSFHELKLGKDPNAEPITSLIDYEQFCGVSKTETATEKETFERMSVSRISESLSSGWKPFVIDVRQPHEAELARLSFADILIPHDQLVDQLSKVPRDREVLVHCKTGMRSAYAASVLKQHAFERVINMEGGIVAWAAEIDTSVPHY
jgi:adenylyltransferase/sulfurtransferase